MLVYVAPPRGKRERATCLEWLNHHGHEVVWLDLRRKVKGPLILCGGADIGRDAERDSKDVCRAGEEFTAFIIPEWATSIEKI
jgi:hypothetical protein